MTHGPTRIISKGECIYCGVKNVRLTDEHILPYFIGGNHIILEASCDECAKITTRFERDIARGFWGDARTSYDAPSRRKKKRKKYIYLEDQYNIDSKLKILYSEYPAPMIFYEMDAAGFY
jgi:HNH endonuclease